MILNYQLTLDDWLEAAKTMKSNTGLKTGNRIILAVCCLLGVCYFYINDRFFKNIALFGISIAVLFLLFVSFGLRFLWSRALKNNPDTLRPVTVVANRQELHFQGHDAESRIKWQKNTRFRETPNLFALHWSPKVFQIIPKRAFANETNLNQFRAWASQIGHEATPNSPLPEIK